MTCVRVCRPCASRHHLNQVPKNSCSFKPDSGASDFKVQHSKDQLHHASAPQRGISAVMSGGMLRSALDAYLMGEFNRTQQIKTVSSYKLSDVSA
jgi:hypothetical protein